MSTHDHHNYYCPECRAPHLVAASAEPFVVSGGRGPIPVPPKPARPGRRPIPVPPKPVRPGRRPGRKGILARLFGKRRRRFGVGKVTAGWTASASKVLPGNKFGLVTGRWVVHVVTNTGHPPLVNAAYVETTSPMQSAKATKVIRLPRPVGSVAPARYDVEAPGGFGRPTRVVLRFTDGTVVKTNVAPAAGRHPGSRSKRKRGFFSRSKRKRGFFSRFFGGSRAGSRRFGVGHSPECGAWVSDHGAHGRQVMSVAGCGGRRY